MVCVDATVLMLIHVRSYYREDLVACCDLHGKAATLGLNQVKRWRQNNKTTLRTPGGFSR